MFRSNKGSHVILLDLYPRNCINCGAPTGIHDDFPCPNRLLTLKELRALARGRVKATKITPEDAAGLDATLDGLFRKGAK